MQYRHLNMEDRATIQFLRAQKKSLRYIAKMLDRPPSTIAREVRRNRCGSRYRAYLAYERAPSRTKSIFRYKRIRDDRVRSYVIEKLKSGWSPEQIAGRIAIDRPGTAISHETIYQFIYCYWGQGEEDLRRIRGVANGHHAILDSDLDAKLSQHDPAKAGLPEIIV